MSQENVIPRSRNVPADDRGRAFQGLDPSRLVRAGDDGIEARRRLSVWLGQVFRSGAMSRGFRRHVPGLVLGVLWLVIAWSLASAMHLSRGFHLAFVFGGLVILSWVARRFDVRAGAGALAASCVAEGFCGACGYSLGGLVAESDGCVKCPECGAAWAHRRITWPHWDNGDPWQRLGRGFFHRQISFQRKRPNRAGADAMGRIVPVLDHALSELGDPARQRMGHRRFAEVRRSLARIGRVTRLIIAAAMSSIVPALGLALIPTRDPGDPGVIALIVFSAVMFVAALAVLASDAFIPARRRVEAMLALGVCPACADELSAGRSVGPGLCACGSCGSVWQTRASEPGGTPTIPAA